MPLTSLAVRDPLHEIAAREHAPAPATNPFSPIDDPDEETVADNPPPDDEPTTIRPTPVPPDLVLLEAAVKDESRSRPRIGKYELHTRIARGAFGVVYTAHDPNLERNVAIKVLRPSHLSNHEVVQRFLREARATARIAHPGIVTILDCGLVETRRGTTAFIAMELLSGESLTSRLARARRLTAADACEIVRQVASALEAAHHVDVLHRDLKPDNIFLVPDPAMPSGERVKVLDFGLAKLGDGGQTQLQSVFGTPRYMSPEQSRSATQIDHRSDIYSLGCILFELVTGRTPFDGDVRQLIERHQRVPPPRAAALAPEVPPVLDQLIADLLAKDPMARPQTMGAVQRALRMALEEPGGAPSPEACTARASWTVLDGRTSRPLPELVLPLPPGSSASPLPASPAAPAARPSSAPPVRPSTASPVRPPSAPPVRPPSAPAVRPPSSPPIRLVPPAAPPGGAALASVEISVTPVSAPLAAPRVTPAASPQIAPLVDAGAVSGEIVVPASCPVPSAPEPARPGTRRPPRVLVALCLFVVAAITAVLLIAL